MNATSSRPWVIAGALLALVLVAATWFLVIGPSRSETQTLRDDTLSVQQQNEILVAKTNKLRKQAENRGQLEADVREALDALPDDAALPDFNQQLAEHAVARGVALSSISVGTAAAPAQADPAAGAPGLIEVPITIQSQGTALDQLYFLRDIQQLGPRAALISSTSLAAGEGSSVDDSSTLTTELTVFAASLSGSDRALLAEVLGADLTSG